MRSAGKKARRTENARPGSG
uniref:Uncharacterized protein n=1 Tax=Arundo donax TaxID=35708 RepID=A0A0A8ZCQ6_ARUDO